LIAVAAIVAVGATACLPNTGAPPSDPTKSGVLQAMNQDRARAGVGALTWSPRLAVLAAVWAQHLASSGTLVHQNLAALITNPDFAGYHTMGENLLVGPAGLTAAQMEATWMGSLEHRANILSGAFDIAGVGRAWSSDGRIWVVVDFGGI